MNEVFLQRLRTTLYVCKIVGCIQFSLEKNPSLLNKVVALLIPLPFNTIGAYCIFMAFGNLDKLTSYTGEGEIVEITNLLSLISTSTIFFLRSGFYFFAKNHTKNIIFQVSNHKRYKKSI